MSVFSHWFNVVSYLSYLRQLTSPAPPPTCHDVFNLMTNENTPDESTTNQLYIYLFSHTKKNLQGGGANPRPFPSLSHMPIYCRHHPYRSQKSRSAHYLVITNAFMGRRLIIN